MSTLYDVCKDDDGKALVKSLFDELSKTGIRSTDPRLDHMVKMLDMLRPLGMPSIEKLRLDAQVYHPTNTHTHTHSTLS